MAVLTATADTSDLQSSADQVADGELWRLFSSGLVVDGVAAPVVSVVVPEAVADVEGDPLSPSQQAATSGSRMAVVRTLRRAVGRDMFPPEWCAGAR